MRANQRTIAIVGGGFSGTVLAVNLLRNASSEPIRIVLIEARPEIGRGVAYQSDDFPHLLNVPASRMSANADEPLQFAQFARRRDADCSPDDFLPRSLYGEYLQELLQQAVQQAAPHVTLERIQARADSLYRIDPTGPYLVSLSNQQRVLADDVVLACGDPPPSSPAGTTIPAGHAAYVCNPHGSAALRPETQTLLLIGSGLTMADMALRAAALNPGVRIHAISRHGLLPAAQTAHSVAPVTGDLLSRLQPGPITARKLARQFRLLLADIECRGGDWRDAVNVARSCAPQIWRAMPAAERGRFLRHLRVYWDVHRHRMPPQISADLERLQQQGVLQVHAGHLLPLQPSGGGQLTAHWRERGTGDVVSLTVDQVINCAGADRRLAQTEDPLLKGLLADGLAVVEPLGLGWRTGELGALIDAKGVAARHLFYLGPMLRAEHWEATAVGELRSYAQRLALELISRVRATPPSRAYSPLQDVHQPADLTRFAGNRVQAPAVASLAAAVKIEQLEQFAPDCASRARLASST